MGGVDEAGKCALFDEHIQWRLVRLLLARGFVWLTVGLYDEPVRARLGYTWTPRDRRLHTLLGRVINTAFALVPHDRRYHPRARAGWKRARGEVAATAPPVQTPRRNLPPRDQRDDPKHYSPDV